MGIADRTDESGKTACAVKALRERVADTELTMNSVREVNAVVKNIMEHTEKLNKVAEILENSVKKFVL